jgi:manganese/zinc/iron transport system ATP- binding protein
VTVAPERATTAAATAAGATAVAVRFRDVTVAYGDRVALDDVDLEVRAGALLAVIGPNGAGKSTLLKAIAGLIAPASGTIEVLGAPPGVGARRVAYVPQAELVDWGFPVTVGDVVMMGRVPLIGIGRSPSRADRTAVRDALESVGLAGQDSRQIGTLSGGQRRRVFLARAMAARPDLYLLDEPVTGVDATTEEDLMHLLEAEAAAGRTVIASTHDLAAAAHHFHQVALINGRIVAIGPSDIVMNRELLRTTYGTIIDDAHHHDDAPSGERHYHEGRS